MLSVAVNLSFGLAKNNKKTLLIDVDPQAHTSVIYCPEIHKDKTIKEAFLNRSFAFDIKNLIQTAVIQKQTVDNLFIIPANIQLASVAEQISSRLHREKLLNNHLDKIKTNYDYIILDCPPSLSVLTVNAIYTADLILIPTIYSRYSLDGIADLFASIDEVKENGKYCFKIIRNTFDSRNKTTNEYINKQLEPFSKDLMKTIIRKKESINQSLMNSEPIWTFDSKASQDFESLTQEILDLKL